MIAHAEGGVDDRVRRIKLKKRALRHLPPVGRAQGTSRPRSAERSEGSLDVPEHSRSIFEQERPRASYRFFPSAMLRRAGIIEPMQDPLSSFATASSAAEQLEALRSLAQAKTLSQASKDKLFSQGLDGLRRATESADHEQRLTALAALGRIWSSLKPLRPNVERLLSLLQIAEPAATSALKDSDDREYVAQAVRFIKAEWVSRYVATAAVAEDSAENARTAHVETLVSTTADITESLRLLASRLSVVSFTTERPADSMGRRIRRLLLSLHIAIGSHSRLGAESAGSELATMISNAFQRFGPPKPEGLRKEVVEAAAQVVHDVIRTHFSQATDPSTYDVLDVLKRWFRPHEWEDIAKGTAAIQFIADDASEAIALLAKAGVADNRMRACLGLALGSERSATLVLAQLAERLSGIRPDIRHWLGIDPNAWTV
jgi:hypothetical protein